jgi:hypothetical protein
MAAGAGAEGVVIVFGGEDFIAPMAARDLPRPKMIDAAVPPHRRLGLAQAA